jgi:hypothetical protein
VRIASSITNARRLMSVMPATSIVGSRSAFDNASFSSERSGKGRCSRSAASLIGAILRREPEHACGARGDDLLVLVAEGAGLRRATARARDHVPAIDR